LLGVVMRDRVLLRSIGLSVACRVAVFVAAMLWPIPNERGAPVSPLLPPAYYDFEFYLDSLARYLSSWADIFAQFVAFYQDPLRPGISFFISGPIFPLLMRVSGFDSGHYLPLSTAYLLLGCATCAVWLWWLRTQQVGGWWLALFAVLPNPVWFMLVVSTDLLFAAEFAAFFLAYFAASGRWRSSTWITALVLMLATRPNSFSVLAFVSLDTSWRVVRGNRVSATRAVAVLVLLIAGSLYLYPYFVAEMSKAGTSLAYFGHVPRDYLDGIFPTLPHVLDVALSWAALAGAKVLYLTGLRPSYGATDPMLVLARAAAGVILLPGVVVLFLAAPTRVRVLVALYCAPLLVGPSQDRYYLAVYPLWFLYGARFWDSIGRLIARRLDVARAPVANSDVL
jgi:hypothetical protein